MTTYDDPSKYLQDDRDTLPVGCEYHGVSGSSQDCYVAVERLLQCRTPIASARIISSGNIHCLLLTTIIGDQIFIKSGFASGYGGAGPTYFSLSLALLYSHDVEIDECSVGEEIIEKIDLSALTNGDVKEILTAKSVRPSRWYDYILEDHHNDSLDGALWQRLEPIMPFSMIDKRIMDLARDFWRDPDGNLMRGYRRLEDIIRARTGATESNTKLFSRVFHSDDALLTWDLDDDGEKKGRVNLFTGVYMAYRNPRAHRERPYSEDLAEFILLNQLYVLESEAVKAEQKPKET